MKWFGIILVSVVLIIGASLGILYSQHLSLIELELVKLKKEVAADFNDPESAKFRSLRLTAPGSFWNNLRSIDADKIWYSSASELIDYVTLKDAPFLLCGEVNARNGFGAYVGYRHFFILGIPSIDHGKNNLPLIDSERSQIASELCETKDDMVVHYSEE